MHLLDPGKLLAWRLRCRLAIYAGLISLLLGACRQAAGVPGQSNPPAVNEATARAPARDYWGCSEGRYGCLDDTQDWLLRLEVPPGFTASHIAQLPPDSAPTSITYGPDGLLYVATIPRPFEETFSGTIYVLAEGEEFIPYATGFLLPTGLAFRPGTRDLYVGSRAGRFEGKVSVVQSNGEIRDIVIGLPCCYTGMEHQPNGLAFGPADGLLYLAIGARTDHGEASQGNPAGLVDPLEAGILRMQPDGSQVEPYARGLRNPYDLDFDWLGQLWTNDNGPDFGLPDRLIRVEEGAHYGFPYYGAESCPDCLSAPRDLVISYACAEFPAHSTPAGMTVYKGVQFPLNYFNSVLVALWNPGPGGKIVRVNSDIDGCSQAGDFVTGLWAPVDIVNAPDGAVVVADYLSGRLFKISWEGGPLIDEMNEQIELDRPAGHARAARGECLTAFQVPAPGRPGRIFLTLSMFFQYNAWQWNRHQRANRCGLSPLYTPPHLIPLELRLAHASCELNALHASGCEGHYVSVYGRHT